MLVRRQSANTSNGDSDSQAFLLGAIMRAKRRLVYGRGVNDADYAVTSYGSVDGRDKQVWICPIYLAWKNMLMRCYSAHSVKSMPTYAECEPIEEWLKFSNFKAWVQDQEWQGMELDKDILVRGNKIYGPEFCVLIPHDLNTFLTDRGALRGEFPIGVYWNARDRKFQAKCQNPFTGRRDYLGYFSSPESAHLAWKRRKHELSCIYADQQSDQRIASALRVRYLHKDFPHAVA